MTMAAAPVVSFVIPVHNEGEMLYLTLEALRSSTAVDHETIVVDDGSTDSCCELLRSAPSLFENTLVLSTARIGAAAARNIGAASAHAPVVVFLDAHCFPRRGWLERLLTTLEDLDGGIVAPSISVAGNPGSQGFGLTILNSDFSVQWLPKEADRAYEVPVAGAACMAMKTAFFHKIGGFDAMRTLGLEDVELCIRCWLFGHSVMVVPDVEVAHVFKEQHTSHVPWQDYLYNMLRTAVLHFEGERLARIVHTLRADPAFPATATSLLLADILERYRFVRAQRKYDADWFCQKFTLNI
ncbi:MAG: glycosyltransferase family 2 protein [Armatimonadota bacterium]